MSEGNCYEVLGCDEKVSKEELKQRYKELALRLHPDKCQDDNTSDVFNKVAKAYKTLDDSEQRVVHDAHLLNKRNDGSAIHDEVSFEDFDLVNEDYQLDCRCGGQYVFSPQDIEGEQVELEVACTTCSLIVLVKKKDT